MLFSAHINTNAHIKQEKKITHFPLCSTKNRFIIFFLFSSFLFSLQTGHIQTSNGTFEIRPIEHFKDENINILHEIKRALPRKHDHVAKDKDSHCDVGDSDGKFICHAICFVN